ncbi:MAG: putative bifunctional diguanylate cyclase/phosphodiesterase [Acidiferrobacterales bacterium]
MKIQRLSLRSSLVITIVAMGLLGLVLALLTGAIYRNLAIEHQRAAVVQMISQEADTLLLDLKKQSYRLAEILQREPAFHAALKNRDSVAVVKRLDNELQARTSVTSRPTGLKLFAYDGEFNLIGESSGGPRQHQLNRLTCENIFSLVGGPKKAAHVSGVSGLCTAGRHPYYAVMVPVVGDNVVGYLQIVADPTQLLRTMAKIFDMPLRLTFSDSTLYKSRDWPQPSVTDKHLVAEYTRPIQYSDKTVKIAVVKDLTPFYKKLAHTRYLVMLVAVVVTALAVAIALMVLRHTALNPLRALTEQLRKLRQDKSHLGQRVHVEGNVEVSELAAGFNDMTTRLKELYESLEHMAFTDHLTKLPNRTLFHDRLKQAILSARRTHKPFALFIMDLDHFKDVNDTLGHHIGDQVLQQVGERLKEKLRESDTVARMGGDEFAILLATVGQKHAEMAARMLLKALRVPFIVEAQSFEIGASIGIALYPEHGEDANVLTQRADVAMYAAKKGSDGVAFYTPQLDRHTPNRLALMGELRHAVDYQQFVIHYQPKVNLQTGELAGLEALVRWQHPEKDIILPDTFIPLMEQSGLIRNLTPWVLNAALRDCHDWHNEGFNIPVSVNLSTRDLQDPYIEESLADLIAACEVKADWLELEMTESTVMIDPVRAMEVLTAIAKTGIKLSIDDFGTGYSSLGYLKKLPVSLIKIDQSFVIDMTRDDGNATIVRSSIELAHNMGLRVIAEGVEDADTLMLLTNLGCDAAQGIFISEPLPITKLKRWLVDSSWGAKLNN